MRTKLKLLFIQCDHTNAQVSRRFGDMQHHFERALATSVEPIDLTVYPLIDLGAKTSTPDVRAFQGVLMSGSACMVSDPLEWIGLGKQLILDSMANDIPFLGVCFGHQLLAATCGALVGPNPHGRMQGTGTFTQNLHHDPLFASLPRHMNVQLSHRDVILQPSPNITVLGHAHHDPFHAIKVGNCAYGVQFHPEWTRAMSETYLRVREEVLSNEHGVAKVQWMHNTLADSDEAERLLPAFARRCAQG